jgi:rubrerythrin
MTTINNTYAIHCPKCGQIFLEDPEFEGKCPFCGWKFEAGE